MKVIKNIFYTLGGIMLLLIGVGAISKAFKDDVLLNEMECIGVDSPYKEQKINLSVYSDKLNDGTYDYFHFDTGKFGSTQMTLNFYRHGLSGNILIMTANKKVVNNIDTYPLQFIKKDTEKEVKINLVCVEKKFIEQKMNK